MPVVTLLDCLVEESRASSVYEFSTIIKLTAREQSFW